MVATVVRLKLTLLRHSLRRDPWRLVVLLLGTLWALGTAPTLLAGAWWLAGPGTAGRPEILVVVGSLLVLGWVVIPVLVFGTDDSLDPVRFATFAVPVRVLVPALGVASAISVPAVFAAAVCALSVVAWAGSSPTVTFVAALGAPVSWVTCLLSARVATLAATRVIGTRTGRRLAAAAVVVVLAAVGLLVGVIGSLGMSAALEGVPALSRVLGWSPLALSWAAPGAAAAGDLSGALGRLIALSESYPDLKANQNFLQLQGELGDIENKLAAARRFFNNAVQEYNTGIQQFPAALFAGIFGFHQQAFFDLGEQRATLEQAPSVKF